MREQNTLPALCRLKQVAIELGQCSEQIGRYTPSLTIIILHLKHSVYRISHLINTQNLHILPTQRTQVFRLNLRTTAVNWLVLFKTCFYYEMETEFLNIVRWISYCERLQSVFFSGTAPTARRLASRNFGTQLSFYHCTCTRLIIHRTVSLFRFSVTLSPVAPSLSLSFFHFALGHTHTHTLSLFTLRMKVTDFVWTALSQRKQTRYLSRKNTFPFFVSDPFHLPVTTHLTQRRTQIIHIPASCTGIEGSNLCPHCGDLWSIPGYPQTLLEKNWNSTSD
jgi:hypothetical protein